MALLECDEAPGGGESFLAGEKTKRGGVVTNNVVVVLDAPSAKPDSDGQGESTFIIGSLFLEGEHWGGKWTYRFGLHILEFMADPLIHVWKLIIAVNNEDTEDAEGARRASPIRLITEVLMYFEREFSSVKLQMENAQAWVNLFNYNYV